MPTPSKPADRRQRRNKPKEIGAQVVAINTTETPAPPAEISDELKDDWIELWQQPIAATFRPEHVPSLRRLFTLRHRVREFEALVLQGDQDDAGWPSSLVKGSTGQLTINPLLKQADAYQAQILALEDRFGLNSLAAMKLGIATGEAHKSLDEMNARIAQRVGGQTDERPDPRISIINTTTA